MEVDQLFEPRMRQDLFWFSQIGEDDARVSVTGEQRAGVHIDNRVRHVIGPPDDHVVSHVHPVEDQDTARSGAKNSRRCASALRAASGARKTSRTL